MLANAAQMAAQQGAQIVDINMGCPAKKVCKKAAGSALLRNEKLVADILQAVTQAVDIPVTLKIRTGWSPEERNGITIAKLAEDAGIAALAVHGRTRACKFQGEAEYETIAKIVGSVSIPVFANGDICTPQQAKTVLSDTGAAGVMIGRAAQGRPWLFRSINHYLATGELLPEPAGEEVEAILRNHLAELHRFYGDYMGVRIARKHIAWYLNALNRNQGTQENEMMCANALRKRFNQLETAEQQIEFVQLILEQLITNEEAA